MGVTLTIENESRLADGGPLTYRLTGKRGADIGRDSHLDWTLPDPSRYVSGKHCEIRYREGAYWLTDVSTNGTYLNGNDHRMQSPYRLQHGDRLSIGNYIVAVALDGEDAGAAATPVAARPAVPYADVWGAEEDAAPPLDPRDFKPPREAAAPVHADFLHHVMDVPEVHEREAAPQPAVRQPAWQPPPDGDWASGSLPQKPAEPPPPAVPNPRRPVWLAEPGGPWTDAPTSEAAEPSEPRRPPQAEQANDAPRPPRLAVPDDAAADFVKRFARGADLPENAFDGLDPGEFAERLGRLMALTVDNLKQLLNARVEAKRLARSTNQTMLQALDNNPLKFSPTAAEAMRVLFGPPTQSYLPADRAFQQSFRDLKTHQVKTFAAMQGALKMLVEDLDPQTIETATEGDRGIGGVLGSRKARLWDAYRARWHAKTHRQQGGIVDVFMLYFAECYDRS